MGDVQFRLFSCGTEEPVGVARRLSAGALSVEIEEGSVRAVRWHDVEVARGVNCLVRDAHWGTFAAAASEDHFEEAAHGFRYERRFAVADGRVHCRFVVEGSDEGIVAVSAEIAALGDLSTNRAGMTLLHPVRGVAGVPLAIRHSDGSVETASFPGQIAPSQPAFDITGLSHAVDGVDVTIAFSGEVFEMEDQRNWSDASFKTYCRPLSLPAPFTLAAGMTLSQQITIRCTGTPKPKAATADAPGVLSLGAATGPFPEVMLALGTEEGADAEAARMLAAAAIGRIVLRLDTDVAADRLATLQPWLAGRAIDIEAVIPDRAEPAAALQELKARLDGADIAPDRLLALPAAYLRSHQPSGPWPAGPTPADAAQAARAVFAGLPIGSGVLTNFTEFNRCRPDAALCDYVSHGTTAIVHAADDRSVMETLEALPAIFASAAALAPGKPYRLGLVSVGMRSNPYGPERPVDPSGRRAAMARVDPRQRGLFAAAFAVGAVAATAGSAVEALALGTPTGPFGILHAPAAWPQPFFDERPGSRILPLFHVVRALAGLGGLPRRMVGGLADGVAAVAAGTSLVVANLGPVPQSVVLGQPAASRLLDAASFEEAAQDAAWLDRAGTPATRLQLGPYAIAFVTLAGDPR